MSIVGASIEYANRHIRVGIHLKTCAKIIHPFCLLFVFKLEEELGGFFGASELSNVGAGFDKVS